MDYSGEPSVITRILRSGEGKQKGQREIELVKESSERCSTAGFGGRERELQARECRQPLETGKG